MDVSPADPQDATTEHVRFEPAVPVALNRASAAELATLPSVDGTLANAIVAHRAQHGPFAAFDELLAVNGMEPARLGGIREAATLEPNDDSPNEEE